MPRNSWMTEAAIPHTLPPPMPYGVFGLFLLCLTSTGCVSLGGQTEELSFRGTDDVVLQGTLVVPKGVATPVPAVVVLHGAEAATRGRIAYKLHANLFLKHGMAVLIYDKRGAGQSGGNHDDRTYAQLVGDAVAAIAAARAHPSVDPSRVGLVGISESGWLTPEIAERSGGDLAFVINKVGSALSVRDTVAWEVYNDLLDDGVSEESARQQVEIRRRIWAYRISPTPEERAALVETLARWAGRSGSQLPTELVERTGTYVDDISYDPTPFLERNTVPMLYLYGTEDINIPTAACVPRLKELIAQGRPLAFHVFDGEGHELGGPGAKPPFYHFAEGYAQVVGDFAQKHVSD